MICTGYGYVFCFFLWLGLSAFVALHSICGCGFLLFLLSHYMHLCYMTKRPNCLLMSLFGTGWGALHFFISCTPQVEKVGRYCVWKKCKRDKKQLLFSSVDIWGGEFIRCRSLRVANHRETWRRAFLHLFDWAHISLKGLLIGEAQVPLNLCIWFLLHILTYIYFYSVYAFYYLRVIYILLFVV